MYNKSVLIVDDLIFCVQPLVRYLKRRGFNNILTASNAIDALRIIENDKPFFVLLDVQLGDAIDGIEILRRTKASLSPKSIVVMLTANKEIHEKICIELGALEVWSKPFDPEPMMENIKRVLSVSLV